MKITALIFQVKNSTMKLSGLNGFFFKVKSRIRNTNLKLCNDNSVVTKEVQ